PTQLFLRYCEDHVGDETEDGVDRVGTDLSSQVAGRALVRSGAEGQVCSYAGHPHQVDVFDDLGVGVGRAVAHDETVALTHLPLAHLGVGRGVAPGHEKDRGCLPQDRVDEFLDLSGPAHDPRSGATVGQQRVETVGDEVHQWVVGGGDDEDELMGNFLVVQSVGVGDHAGDDVLPRLLPPLQSDGLGVAEQTGHGRFGRLASVPDLPHQVDQLLPVFIIQAEGPVEQKERQPEGEVAHQVGPAGAYRLVHEFVYEFSYRHQGPGRGEGLEGLHDHLAVTTVVGRIAGQGVAKVPEGAGYLVGGGSPLACLGPSSGVSGEVVGVLQDAAVEFITQ